MQIRQPPSRSWYSFFLIELMLDFVVIFLFNFVRVIMGRELLAEGDYYTLPTLIAIILGMRLLFLSLSILPSIKVGSETYFEKKSEVQNLAVVLSIFAGLLIVNIGNFLQHLDYSMYAWVNENPLLIGSLQVLLLRNLFDFVPRAFRNSSDAFVKFLFKIAYATSALTVGGALFLAVLLAIGIYFNLDAIVF